MLKIIYLHIKFQVSKYTHWRYFTIKNLIHEVMNMYVGCGQVHDIFCPMNQHNFKVLVHLKSWQPNLLELELIKYQGQSQLQCNVSLIFLLLMIYKTANDLWHTHLFHFFPSLFHVDFPRFLQTQIFIQIKHSIYAYFKLLLWKVIS